MVTIKDISKRCNVSPATVSKALNGYEDISKETIELVKRTAQEMHYMPNAAARQLKTNISHNIGVLFVDDTMCGLTHEYFSAILNSTKEEAERLGYDITFISQNIGGEKISFAEHCRYRKCDGVGIEVPEEYVIKAVYHDLKSSAKATEYLMQLDDPPTAIMYPDDFSYIGGMNQLERMGLSIPDDVSVTGYDGITLSEVLRPKLTTYYQDAEAIGRESARRLVDVIENPKTSIPEKIMVTGRLIEGKSVKQI